MIDFAARGPLGLKDRKDPVLNKARKPIPRESKKRKAFKASAAGKAGRAHMARVAELRCVCCGATPVQVHHCISGRFSQSKASDFDTIPLCWNHHQGPDGIHTDKTAWEKANGLDTDYLPSVADQLAGQFNSPWRD